MFKTGNQPFRARRFGNSIFCGARARRNGRILLAAAGVATWATSSAHATTYQWKDVNGSWSLTTNWTPTGLPGSGGVNVDIANVTSTLTTAFTCSYDYTGAAETLQDLNVDLTGAGSAVATLNFASTLSPALTATIEQVGLNGRGALIQSTGVNTVNQAIAIGCAPGSTGSYTLSGTGVLNAAGEILSENNSCSGLFNQTGGTNTLTNSGSLFVGQNAIANYDLSGGVLNVTGIGAEVLGFGIQGTGIFTQTNGLNNASNLQMGTTNGPGYYILQGGTLTTSNTQSIGVGTFGQSAGMNDLANGTLAIGSSLGVTGNYVLGGGELAAIGSSSTEFIGLVGTGIFTQSGSSTNVLNFSATMYVGYDVGSNGTYNFQGGTISQTIGSEYVGYNGTGVFNQSSGTNTLFNSFSALTIGSSGGATGTYLLSGGSLSVAGDEIVGNEGTAAFAQSGGVNSVAGTLHIAENGGTGSYTLSGTGSVSAATEYVGEYGCGYFTQGAGTSNTISSDFEVALHVGSTGTYIMNGGAINVIDGASEVVGDDGTAAFDQNGGTNTVSGTFYLGSAFLGVPGAVDSYDLTAGSLTAAGGENIGAGTGGTFYQIGGTNTSGGTLSIGGSGYNSGYYMEAGTLTAPNIATTYESSFNVSGGTVICSGTLTTTPTVSIFNGGMATLTGGILNVAAINNQGSPSDFSWTGGTLGLTQGITFDSAAAPTSTSAAFGSYLSLNSGMELNVTGNETIGGVGPFTLNLSSGSIDVASGSFTVAPAGTLYQSGGPISQSITNQGIFDYDGGLFNGELFNQGVANFSISFTTPNGIVNTGEIASVPLGVTLTVNGVGLPNSGSIGLSGGELLSSASPISNTGLISGWGTISTSNFSNSGVINQSGGNLTLTSTGSAFDNQGTINLASGLSFIVNGMTNDWAINLNSGMLNAGSFALTNNADGVITGPGKIIAAGFLNNGTLNVPSGNLSAGGFTNNGVIELQGGELESVGSTIVNSASATIEGYGKISENITNSGTIQPTGNGTIDVNGTMTNPASGIIAIGAGNKLLVGNGLASNAGLITMTGGTFDNGNQPLTNAAGGQITGYGVIRTGGTGLTNNGIMYLTGGTSTVNGNVTNNTTINLNFQPATFTGSVFNYGTIKTTGMTATYSGSLTNEAGSHYTSDPSENVFQSAVINAGTMTGGSGDQYLLSGGTFNNSGTYTNAGYLQSSDPTTNSGTFTQNGAQSWATGTTFTNTAGVATFGMDTGSASSYPLSFNVSGGKVTFNANQHIAGLTMTPGSGQVDVTSSTVLVDYAGGTDPVAAIAGYLATGYNHGAWNGTGVESSAVVALNGSQSSLIYSIGYADGSDGITNVPSGEVEILPTLAGDAKLQGNVVFGDFQLLSQYFGQTGTSWDEGDFSYTNSTNFGDFQLLSQNFGANASALTAGQVASLDGFAAQFGEQVVSNPDGVGLSLVSVPEPASIGMSVMAGFGLLARRRNRRAKSH